MNAIYASIICMAGALVCLVVRQHRPEMAAATAIAAGTAALMVCLPDIRSAVQAIRSLVNAAGLQEGYVSSMLRACGIAIIGEFASQICQDAGETALSGRIKLAQRLAITVMAVPMIADILAQSMSFVQF